MRRIRQRLGALTVIAVAAASLSVAPASAATHRIGMTKAEWQAAIARVSEPGTGCYRASYPALRWHAVTCAVAPMFPVAPVLPSGPATRAGSATVGNGNDYVAKVSKLISKATGTFHGVSSKITEKGKVGNEGSEVANAFSLQLNTQFFHGSPACSGSSVPADCLAWQQFVYSTSNPSQAGSVYMQYWLLYYDTTCPANWKPYKFTSKGKTYIFCYTNSRSARIAPLTAKDLATVTLSGSAAKGGQDKVSLSLGSGQATLVTNSDSKIDLAKAWNTTEWGVFGDGSGGEAFFGANTTLEAQTALTATSHSAPTCISKDGTTAETNNLTLASTPALGGEPSPTMASRQTNGTAGTASCAVAS